MKAALAVVLVVLSVLPACRSAAAEQREAEQQRIEFERRRQGLRSIVGQFCQEIEAAGSAVAAASDDYGIKRVSVRFRMAVIGEAQSSLDYFESGLAGGLEVWALAFQLRDYFATERGSVRFGAHTHIVVEVVDSLLAEIGRRAVEQYELESVAEAESSLEEFARANPLSDAFGRAPLQQSILDLRGRGGAFAWLGSLSLDTFNPFSSVGSGISEGAAAIEGFNRVAERFNDTIAWMPRQVGWQLELLQYDFEESALTVSVAADLERLTATVETLPDMPAQVRSEVEALLRELEPQLASVGEVLRETATAADALDRTGATFDDTAQSLDAMAAQLDTTLTTFKDTLAFLGVGAAPEPPDPDAPPSKPFDVLEFDQTAKSLTAMAAQLDETLGSLRGLVEADEVGLRLREVESSARSTVESLVWSAAIAVLAVLAGFFGLLAVYRRVSVGWTSKTSP